MEVKQTLKKNLNTYTTWKEFQHKYGYRLLEPIGEATPPTLYKVKSIYDRKKYCVKLCYNSFSDLKAAK